MKSALIAGATSALLAATVAAQIPDALVPSGSLDGMFRLTDRDNDGDYDSLGEAYDYLLHGQNTSVRNIIWVVGAPSRLWYTSTVTEQILSAWDANGDGIIDVGTEETVALDFVTFFSSATHEVNSIAYDGNGAFYVTNDSGLVEGIHRCQDMNNDGDFADAGETTNALVEPTAVFVNNAPNSNNPPLLLDQLDSIEYDPTWGQNGRYLIEEESYDFTLAVEDMNGDGDFDDAGEAYLFSALWAGTGTLSQDVNPDVTAGLLPSSNEIRQHAVDAGTNPPTYYLLSADTNAPGPDNAIVYRGVDGNNDGDVNDAGEVTIFWDGSFDTTGANNEYNFCYGIELFGRDVFLTCEWNGDPDEERFIRLNDANNDNDAQDAGELTVLWSLPQDKTHYDPVMIPAAVMPAPPAGTPGVWRYYGEAICATSTGFHNIQVGTDNFNDKVTIGNAGFMMRTWGVVASGVGAYIVGATQINTPLDPPTNSCHLYTNPIVDFTFTTDAAGESNDPVPIPNDTALIGAFLAWQSVAIDAGASLGFSTSDAARMTLGPAGYSYSIH